ncbi:helix-turn-helix domain-containing protein [Xanthocytophaga flava]|uniref:helix-turn-helix domain-containing protein n=1 Tax=Xanthocytophaga flava TaxID=3048013 RepID=UPI0028D250B9|nr:helix-turn-helix domain-containing protein [Xanthocytophaga flavus]MDJ1471711.1 helix-turn-helix domain-containing protein [Xanthocytophaga flavus]
MSDTLLLSLKPQEYIPIYQLDRDTIFVYTSDDPAFHGFGGSHRNDFFEIIWFTSNADVHYIDFTPHPILKDTVYLLGRNQVHAIPGSKPAARVIAFSRELMYAIEEDHLRYLFLPFTNDGITIPPDMVEPMAHLFDLMYLECKTKADVGVLHLYLRLFLIHLYRFSQTLSSSIALHDERVKKIYILISDHYKEERNVTFYANAVNLTPKRLNEVLKERLGVTVTQIIHTYLVIEAKRQILIGKRTFKEIAFELGFSEQAYFSRFFKKQTGITPETFQQVALGIFR